MSHDTVTADSTPSRHGQPGWRRCGLAVPHPPSSSRATHAVARNFRERKNISRSKSVLWPIIEYFAAPSCRGSKPVTRNAHRDAALAVRTCMSPSAFTNATTATSTASWTTTIVRARSQSGSSRKSLPIMTL